MADNAISSTPVGEVVNLTGQAQAISGSEVRDLSPGSPVYQGDTIVTNQGSQLEIDFIDDTSFSQGENSRSEINSYVYDPDDASGSGLLFELSKGVFRTVTGEIAKQNPDNFNLKSPMALIGIRGTVVNSDIQEGFEKIGVETIGKGHVLVIQDSQGNVQFISDPLKIMEIIQGQPLGTARDMTRQEVRDFQNFAPNSIDNNLDRRGELESRLNAAEAEARAEEAAEAAEEAEEAAAREAAEAAEAEAEAAEAAAAAEEAAREAEEAEAVLKAAEEAGDAEALALAQEAVQQAAQAAAQAQAKAAEAAEAAGRQVQAAQEAARLAQELADLKTAAQIEAEQKAAEIIEAPENTNPQTNTWTDTNRSDVLGVIEVDSQGQTKYYAATDTTTKDNGQPQQEEEDDQLVKQEEQEQNNAPAAKTDKAATDEDTPVTINVLANDTDADGDALAVDSVTQGSHGKVSITSGGGDVIYSPDSKYNGEDSFTYTVRDGNGGTSTATVNVTVNAVNDDPVANDDTKTIQKGTTHVTIDVLANDTDVDGDALVIDSVTQGSHGEVFITNDGSDVTYTPDPDYYGEDIFTYTVSDGKGGTATASVVIQINDGPVAENDEAVTDEDTPVVIDVLANDTDADGDSLAVDSVTQGAYGEVSITSGGSDVTYT
ncbi:MAG: tandem-95 repeat protein, partial [Desulfotignum sp.]|nr:tandem-95 repeat protein [Desulfotignum sp.]